jgi:hypothetical protein
MCDAELSRAAARPPSLSRITPTQPQHPHRQIELRDSPSGVQQFEAHPRQHVEDDADRENK